MARVKGGTTKAKAASKPAVMGPGDKVVRFINNLTHTGDFSGVPFKLREWQAEMVRKLFGTLRPDGLRQYRKAFWALPRKQGKTELAAGILLYLLLGTGKKGQQLYSASGDRAQAGLIFRAAAAMVRADERLSRVCQVYDGYKRIACDPLDSFYEALSSDAPRKHGLGPSAVLFDEVHVLPNRELHDVLTTGYGARKEPLTLYISTAGFDRQSLCYELWNYAEQVRDGIIDDPTFLPVLYAAGADEDWTDEAVWHRVMPALGDFCSLEFIQDECRKAKELPSYENTFRQLYLNQWTQAATRWLPRDAWDACGFLPVDLAEVAGLPCWGGLDLSSTTDLAALAMVFRGEDNRYKVVMKFWLPEETAERRERRDRVSYLTWARQGFLTLTPGASIDYEFIRQELLAINHTYDLRKLLCDPWNATQLGQQLVSDGVPIEFFRQGFVSMNGPVKELERLVIAGSIDHGNHPVLNWCADNAVVVKDAAGNQKLSKEKSREKIDGMIALVEAIAGAMDGNSAIERSVYEDRGILLL